MTISKYKKTLVLILFTCITSVMCLKTHGSETKFELKQVIPTANQPAERPLFELLNNTTTDPITNNNNKWGSNPFFKPPSAPVPVQQTPITREPDPVNLFEYKITAIWTVRNKYKALISGHIVSQGDRINAIQISKITNKDITVKRGSKSKTFRLGTIFYDFQI